jgi:hypothetical protein
MADASLSLITSYSLMILPVTGLMDFILYFLFLYRPI